jgi:predicted nucleic acid-binding protein
VKVTNRIGIDSNCLSYLIHAISGVSEPTELADEKKALYRTYLYTEGTLYVTPTVKKECLEICNDELRATHESFIDVLFGVWPITNQIEVDRKVEELLPQHNKLNDCKIFAEAESGGIRTLLTYDSNLLARLSSKSAILHLSRPSEFWAELALPKGVTPKKVPESSNPLSGQEWWRW